MRRSTPHRSNATGRNRADRRQEPGKGNTRRNNTSKADPRPHERRAGARGERLRKPQRERTAGREPRAHSEEPERLQKVLARAGLASRREVEDWIRAGRITVNGQIAALGVRVTASDQVRLDGRLVRQREASGGAPAFICHRSPGEDLRHPIEDPADEGSGPGRTALLERMPRRAGRRFITISPMPRVDGGLELVTSDGELAAKLQRSIRQLVNEFSVRVRGELGEQQIQGVLSGTLDSGERVEVERCEPGGGEGTNRWYTVAARGASGKDIRQLFERQGALVSRVLRTHLGPLTLERSLARGQFRELTREELHALLSTTVEPAGG